MINRVKLLLALIMAFGSSVVYAQSGLWRPIEQAHRSQGGGEFTGYQYRVELRSLRQILGRAVAEGQTSASSQIELPTIDGTLERFDLYTSPVMAPGLAARFPEIRTYKVYGVDNPLASGRISISPKGFHGMISSPAGVFYIDPQAGDTYRGYARKYRTASQPFKCGVDGHTHATPLGGNLTTAGRVAARSPGSLHVYRLAVAATGEYVAAVSSPNPPNVADALAEVVIAINRVNEIYERDLAIRLELIDRNDELMFLDPGTDGYTNTDGFEMLSENQGIIDRIIGTQNYDIGHVFSTGGGGIAQVGAVCVAGFKAQGVTGLLNPTGETFYIDFVAHEIGHQFDAEHTFNGTSGPSLPGQLSNCASGRVASNAVEPGSGSTIMAYAGLCDSDENIEEFSDAAFHAASIAQIDTYTTSGFGSTCGSLATITNNASYPTVSAGSDFSIPAGTPFMLTGSATDADGDSLSYSWEQLDTGTATDENTFGTDLGDNPLMRSLLPQAGATRYFPALATVLEGLNDPAEVLPTTTRDLNFRLTVRDGKSGVASDDTTIRATAAMSPFIVTSHSSSTSLTEGSNQDINWNVAGTTASPVNCSSVDIDLLLMDATRSNYCEQRLATAEPNDGVASVLLPSLSAPVVAFKVSCSNNVFYALSQGSLSLGIGNSAFTQCSPVPVDPTLQEHAGIDVQTGDVVVIEPPPSSGGGGGVFGAWWIYLLLVAASVRRYAVMAGKRA